MREVLDAVSARIKAPYFGYAALAFVALNWRAFFVLSLTTGSPQERLTAFDAGTNFFSLVLGPLLIAAAITLLSPWISYVVAYLSKKPHHLVDLIQLDSDHQKTLRKTELEQSRSEFFANKETELIDRAKRDQAIQDIDDEELKSRLALQIESLRRERDELSESLTKTSPKVHFSPPEIDLLTAASAEESGSITRNVWMSGQSIEAGGRTFGEHDKKEYLKYDAALKSLVSKELVQAMGTKGHLYELTYAGWKAAEALPF